MQYLSPSSLLGATLSQPLDKKAIQLGRKKLLAELELAGGESIGIRGTAFSKNEIIAWFEELEKPNIAAFHDAVAEDPVLLDFLEKGSIGPLHRFHVNPIYEDYSFLRWISPYFYSSFTTLANTCLRQGEDEGLGDVLNNPLLMTSTDQEQAWNFIARILTNNIGFLDYYREQKSPKGKNKMSTEEVSHLMDDGYTSLLCLLPESRFGEIRNQHAFIMMQACIYTFNRHPGERTATDSWMRNAESLATSPEQKKQIAAKRGEMNNFRKKKRWSIGVRVLIAVLILSNLARFSSNDDPNTIPTKTYFTLPGDTTKHLLNKNNMDSLLHYRTQGTYRY